MVLEDYMEAQLQKSQSNPVIRRSSEDFSSERRLAHLITRLEKRLDEDAASTFTGEDLAFQLTDLKLEIQELTKERSRTENILSWLLLFVSSMTLVSVIYLSGYIIQAGK